MSGLALVCARLGADGQRQRPRRLLLYGAAARRRGLDPPVGHDAANLPEGAEVVVSTAIAEDNPELAAARERGLEVIHRGELLAELCAEKRLIAIAGTHGKTTTTAMAVWALRAIGADPAFFVGGEVPGLGEDGRAGQRRLGGGGVGRRRGRRERRQLPRAGARDRGDHQHRDGPPLALGLDRRAARRLRRASPRGARVAEFDAGLARARRSSRSRSPAATTVLNARAALAAVELAGLRPRGGSRGAAGLPRGAAAARAQGGARRRPGLRRLRPPPDRGAGGALGAARARPRAAGRRLPAAPLLADQGLRRGVRRRPGARRRSRSSSTSTRPGRSRSASSRGSTACSSPAPPPTAWAAGRWSGRRPSTPARAALARPRGPGPGPGHGRRRRRLHRRRAAGRRWRGPEDERPPRRRVERDYPLARLTTVRTGGPADWFARPATEEELVELLAWADREGARDRDRRVGLEPAGRRRGLPRAGAEARRRAGGDRARRRAGRLRRRRPASLGRGEGRGLGALRPRVRDQHPRNRGRRGAG